MLFFRRNYQSLSDEELLVLHRKGKSEAFEELYQRYHRKVFYFFYKMLGQDKDKADDFLHDLFLKVIERPEIIDPDRKFSSWLYTVAGNMCKNEYRKLEVQRQKNINVSIEESEEHDHDESLTHQSFKKDLHKCLDRLEPEVRMIFLLRFDEELQIKEIATITGCSEGTVKSRIHYTLKKLSDQLKIYKP